MGQCHHRRHIHTGTATQTAPTAAFPDPAAKGGPDALRHLRRIFALDFGTAFKAYDLFCLWPCIFLVQDQLLVKQVWEGHL